MTSDRGAEAIRVDDNAAGSFRRVCSRPTRGLVQSDVPRNMRPLPEGDRAVGANERHNGSTGGDAKPPETPVLPAKRSTAESQMGSSDSKRPWFADLGRLCALRHL